MQGAAPHPAPENQYSPPSNPAPRCACAARAAPGTLGSRSARRHPGRPSNSCLGAPADERTLRGAAAACCCSGATHQVGKVAFGRIAQSLAGRPQSSDLGKRWRRRTRRGRSLRFQAGRPGLGPTRSGRLRRSKWRKWHRFVRLPCWTPTHPQNCPCEGPPVESLFLHDRLSPETPRSISKRWKCHDEVGASDPLPHRGEARKTGLRPPIPSMRTRHRRYPLPRGHWVL